MVSLERLSAALERLSEKLGMVLVGLFTLVVLAAVAFRYVLVMPLTWSEEVARFAMVWVAFIAGSVALKRGEHVNVDVLLLAIRGARALGAVKLCVHLCMGWLLVILVWHGSRLVVASLATTTPALGIALAWPYLGLPLGSLLMLVHVGTFLCRDIRQLTRPPK